MIIGKMFPLEKVGIKKQTYPNSLGADVLFSMSGRCAIYSCLLDIRPNDNRRVAYVPAYTCETVLDCYKKAGYKCRFYDIDPEGLKPRFIEENLDGVSVFSLCGYYGFSTYDSGFLKICKDRNILILQDITHTPFEPNPMSDYLAGSLRKWMGVACGGIAVKRSASFSIALIPADMEYLEGRYNFLNSVEENAHGADQTDDDKSRTLFWENELELRRKFDSFGSDQLSRSILEYFPYDRMIAKRRENYRCILTHLERQEGWKLIFPDLIGQATPSHLSVYADNREDFRHHLESAGIGSTVYWPVPPMIDDIEAYPGAKEIYSHICSIQIDQRYDVDEMRELASSLNDYNR